MQCAIRLCGHCQLGPYFVCTDGPVFRYDEVRDLMEVRGPVSTNVKPRVAVFKMASCDGCQLQFLDAEGRCSSSPARSISSISPRRRAASNPVRTT